MIACQVRPRKPRFSGDVMVAAGAWDMVGWTASGFASLAEVWEGFFVLAPGFPRNFVFGLSVVTVEVARFMVKVGSRIVTILVDVAVAGVVVASGAVKTLGVEVAVPKTSPLDELPPPPPEPGELGCGNEFRIDTQLWPEAAVTA